MIKTEIEEEPGQEQELIKRPLNTQWLIIASCLALIVVAIVLTVVLLPNSSPKLPNDPSKYSGLSALPLNGSSEPAVTPTTANQSTYSQSPKDSTSLGASYANLQDVPQSSGHPTTSPLQSTGAAQSTGQTINPSLPY